jgi:predicted DNA-binding transcriptional regulator AlpA
MLTINGNNYLVEKELAVKYGLSVHWFRKARNQGKSPPYYKLNGKVYYCETNVEEWFNQNLVSFK